jgi:hypothetical protein
MIKRKESILIAEDTPWREKTVKLLQPNRKWITSVAQVIS